MRNVRMYVDGYNFYYAIKQKYRLDRDKLRQESLIGLGWCDFRRLGEHMIDRNIAVEIVLDALDARASHKAILISGDTDFAPAVYAVQKGMVDRGLLRSGKTIDVWVPPGIPTNGWHGYF